MKFYPRQDSLILLTLCAILYWVLPLIDLALTHFLNPDGKYFFIYLLFIFPIITFGFALKDSIRNGFCWWWIIAPFMLFLPTIYFDYNDSALIYGVIYSVLGTLGMLIGWITKILTLPKE